VFEDVVNDEVGTCVELVSRVITSVLLTAVGPVMAGGLRLVVIANTVDVMPEEEVFDDGERPRAELVTKLLPTELEISTSTDVVLVVRIVFASCVTSRELVVADSLWDDDCRYPRAVLLPVASLSELRVEATGCPVKVVQVVFAFAVENEVTRTELKVGVAE